MLLPIEGAHRVGTEKRERVFLGQLIPELFQPYCRIGLTLGPQHGDHLTEGGDPGTLALSG